MPALSSENFISPVSTQDALIQVIKTAFNNFGGTSTLFVEKVQGTNKVVVFKIDLQSETGIHTTYLQIKITNNLAVSQQLFAGWDNNDSGISGSQESTPITLYKPSPINIRTFYKSDEFAFLVFFQPARYLLLGWLRPQTKHPDFNEAIAPFIFQSNNDWNKPFVNWHSTALSPYGNAAYTSNMGSPYLSQANPSNNKRDLLAGMLLFSNSGRGIAGKTSTDIVSAASAGLNTFESIQGADGSQYTLLYPGNGGLAVKVENPSVT